MSDSAQPTWTLEDAEKIANEHPYTFYKPSPEAIALLAPGCNVKLIFAFQSDDPSAPRAERMWVQIEDVNTGIFVGRLDNEPRYIADLKLGAKIHFEAKHIINTDVADPIPSIVDKDVARCIVARKILDEGIPVGFLSREEPNDDKDSGWFMLGGDETDEYMDDSDNFACVSLGAILSVDDSILALLDSPIGSAFKRDVDSGQFQPVDED